MSMVLDGIRVIELAEALAGPYCAMLLGDLGADVIKVERNAGGDQSRGWGPPFVGTESAYYLATNRNKRSISLNYDHPLGGEILQRLLSTADVFICNQPSILSLQRRGLDPQTLRGKYPRLIYCSISGYGFTGPKAEQPGYDILAQAEAGVMSFTGEPEGGPLRFPIAIADMTTGMYSAMGILGALFARERSGKGDYLDMALFDSQLTWLANVGSSYLNAGVSPRRWGNAHPNIVPYQLFRGSDGRYFVVGVGTQEQWRRLVRILGAEELGNDMRFANNAARNENREHLIPLLQRYFERFESAAWLARLKEADIPVAPIQTVGEALGDAQTLARGLVVELEHPTLRVAKSIANPIRLSEQPIVYRLPPPLLGEHSKSILRDLRYTEGQITEALKEACSGAKRSKHDTK
ncbi:MAG TPA: CaiB/BaiF CoA-transferase family protein [Candidatus Sulfotelmatobacter sp.]|jgi:crotonobetainyl-CoA:carnitine CoA-transferase CaiB-like acyl-CoA transferase|nr:CaiB/BaiF CoA-transferase family protein [Candidatus Sulfotelmatobacter sp.]